MFECQNITFAYKQQPLFQHFSARLAPGKITALLGPNGSGKSSLLKLVARQATPQQGQVLLQGKPLKDWKARSFAQTVTLVNQEHATPPAITVREFLLYGRLPYRSWDLRFTKADRERVEEVLTQTNLEGLAEQPLTALSGGQRQRAYLAQAFVQETEIILLDEPTTYLDMQAQIDFFELIQEYQRRFGSTVIMVLHDVNQALQYSQEVVLLQRGQLMAQGPTATTLDQRTIEALLGVRGQLVASEGELPAYFRTIGTVKEGVKLK